MRFLHVFTLLALLFPPPDPPEEEIDPEMLVQYEEVEQALNGLEDWDIAEPIKEEESNATDEQELE